jgi:NAD(P)-dependent dehydrogenase (short-subunit alcohol dehydrogenase family)
MSERKVAFVTGASRGIGKASSIALAYSGFDVVVTARTLEEGKTADGRPLPGSVETTAAAVVEAGREALPLHLDLLDRASLDAAVDTTLEHWGHVDVLLNNGIYTGPGNMQHFLELDLADVETMFQANVFSQIHITGRLLPGMLERKSGTIINMVSGAGLTDPPMPAGEGGWGFAYGATKGAFQRMVGVLAVEHRESGVHFYNLEPGFVMTEAMRLNDPDGALEKFQQPAPPSVPAAVIAWLATNRGAPEWNGKTVFAQKLALATGLHPDWRS